MAKIQKGVKPDIFKYADLDKNNMSRSEDVMVDKKDRTKEFNAQLQVLEIPNEIKEGLSTI